MCPQALPIALAMFLMSCPFLYLYYAPPRTQCQGFWCAIFEAPLDNFPGRHYSSGR